MAENASSKRVVYVALAGDVLVAATKFIAATFTGSSSMASEGFHSVVDAGNGLLLLYGYRRSKRQPDESHPLGYGRELYFWSFVVALLLFTLGAGLSLIEGISRLAAPRPIENAIAAYAVLAASALFEGVAWRAALKAFKMAKGDIGYWRAIRTSKDPPVFMVLVENTAALIGLAIAAAGTFLATRFDNPAFDGSASVLVGILLAVVAWVLARENKELLIGEQANRDLEASLIALAEEENGVDGANGGMTSHLSPDQVIAALSIEFSDDLRAPDIEETVLSLERRIRARHPEVIALFVKPQTRRTFERARRFRWRPTGGLDGFGPQKSVEPKERIYTEETRAIGEREEAREQAQQRPPLDEVRSAEVLRPRKSQQPMRRRAMEKTRDAGNSKLKAAAKDALGLPPGDGTPHSKGRKPTDPDTSGNLTSADREPNRPAAREHEE